MPSRLKAAFGLSLIAALVFSSMSVMSASGKVSGHFTSASANTKYSATENTAGGHSVTLSAYGTSVSCHNPQYEVHHTSSTTVTEITVTPIKDTEWNCTTGSGEKAEVHFKGCHYKFSSVKTGHGTVHFICPAVYAEVTTPSGTMKFTTQTPTTGGAVYTNQPDGTITVDITAEGIHGTCHGLCQFLGTETKTAKMTGSATIAGFNTITGDPTLITAT